MTPYWMEFFNASSSSVLKYGIMNSAPRNRYERTKPNTRPNMATETVVINRFVNPISTTTKNNPVHAPPTIPYSSFSIGTNFHPITAANAMKRSLNRLSI
ncbi:MAG: hypothetical protein RDV41_05335 [Planctomycetota bacterium]|nr:hypothetical protein [Planctomycetota bacterium]